MGAELRHCEQAGKVLRETFGGCARRRWLAQRGSSCGERARMHGADARWRAERGRDGGHWTRTVNVLIARRGSCEPLRAAQGRAAQDARRGVGRLSAPWRRALLYGRAATERTGLGELRAARGVGAQAHSRLGEVVGICRMRNTPCAAAGCERAADDAGGRSARQPPVGSCGGRGSCAAPEMAIQCARSRH
jgi:hypothetical protein